MTIWNDPGDAWASSCESSFYFDYLSCDPLKSFYWTSLREPATYTSRSVLFTGEIALLDDRFTECLAQTGRSLFFSNIPPKMGVGMFQKYKGAVDSSLRWLLEVAFVPWMSSDSLLALSFSKTRIGRDWTLLRLAPVFGVAINNFIYVYN